MARKVFIYAVAGVIALNLAIFLWVLFSPSTPHVVLPNPNGYDDFVKAGQVLSGTNASVTLVSTTQIAAMIKSNVVRTNPLYYSDKMTKAELTTFITGKDEAIRLVREGLARECCEPVEYSSSYSLTLISRISSFKQVEQLLVAEGRLAESNGSSDDAAKIYLDGVRFGQECGRGGLLISRLVGIAYEATGLSRLQSLIDAVDATNSRAIAQALETADGNEEPMQKVFDRDKIWNRKTSSIGQRIVTLIKYKETQKSLDRALARIQGTQSQRRRLIINFAARAYELEKGKPPQSAADLVPEYLKAVPKDPATGKELRLEGK